MTLESSSTQEPGRGWRYGVPPGTNEISNLLEEVRIMTSLSETRKSGKLGRGKDRNHPKLRIIYD